MFYSTRLKFLICLFVFCLNLEMGCLQSSIPSAEIEKKIQDIVEDIRFFRFALAQEQIINLGDNQKIFQIIHSYYKKSVDSIDEILKFVEALTRVDLSFYVIKALRNETKANGLNDPLKMISLVRALENNVVFQKNDNKIIAAESIELIEEIKVDIKEAAKKILTAAILSRNYFGNYRAESVAEGIYNFFYDSSDEIMREIVNKTFPIISASDIAETIMISSKYSSQKASVFLALFEILERNNDLNNKAVLQIASYVKNLEMESNYVNLFRHQKYEINIMIDKLPTCARNLYFSDEMCIWSRGRSEYLYADVSNHSSQRSVYTRPPEALTEFEGVWTVDTINDVFYFKNKAFKKEYLDVSKNKTYWLTRHVLTRETVGSFLEKSSPWTVELSGEYCYIKNHYNGAEYLFTSDRMNDEGQRHVYTTTAIAANLDPLDFQWQIRDCK